MSKKSRKVFENIQLDKVVHGGQCIATAPDGKKIFVWGGLPGEIVNVSVFKKKSGYYEATVTDIITQSKFRVNAIEPESYLSTSPWQIYEFSYENKLKSEILEESFNRESLDVEWEEFTSADNKLNYRNKMEFGFWGDDSGLHLAHFKRGSHGKVAVSGSVLANESINKAAKDVIKELNKLNVWAGGLKTLVLRCNKKGDTVAALFIKQEDLDLTNFVIPASLKGLVVYYSDPRSPASIVTKKLYALGDIKLLDSISGINITYDVLSFFQVNLPVFEKALLEINQEINREPSVDFYSGVGTIGLVVGSESLIESDESNIAMAALNCKDTNTEIIHTSSEKAVDHIVGDKILILDPPRAGLHKDVIRRIIEVRPPKIVYLSCNPSTQARDIASLIEDYDVAIARGYNFFPMTPHIESLVCLKLK